MAVVVVVVALAGAWAGDVGRDAVAVAGPAAAAGNVGVVGAAEAAQKAAGLVDLH